MSWLDMINYLFDGLLILIPTFVIGIAIITMYIKKHLRDDNR